MALDFKSMIKDKRFQVAAAVVGGAAVITIIRRKGAAGDQAKDAATSGTSNGTAASGYYTGAGSTVGTDLAGFLSDYSSRLDGRLAEFADNQDKILDGLNAAPSNPFDGVQYTPGINTTGPIRDGTSLRDLTKIYWGREDQAAQDWFRFANLQKIGGAGGKLTGLDLYVPPAPPAAR